MAIDYAVTKSIACTTQIKHNFPTVDIIKNDTRVIAMMDQVWMISKSLANETHSAEIGFVIYMKTSPDGYSYGSDTLFTNSVKYGVRPCVTIEGYSMVVPFLRTVFL